MRFSSKKMCRFAIGGLAMCLGSALAHADLITNGGFETGDFTGWTVSASFTSVQAASGGYVPHSGTYFAHLGDISSSFPYGTLSQAVTTTAGQAYDLGYWLASDGATPNYFDAQWNGAIIAGSALTDIPSSDYTQYTFSVTGTGSDTLLFNEQNVPAYLSLDDISLNPSTTIPDPTTIALVGVGLLGLGFSRRKRAR